MKRKLFTRDPARNDITLQVKAADSPVGPWTTVASSINGAGIVSETDAGAGLKSVEIRDTVNMSAAPHRFMRIEVAR